MKLFCVCAPEMTDEQDGRTRRRWRGRGLSASLSARGDGTTERTNNVVGTVIVRLRMSYQRP